MEVGYVDVKITEHLFWAISRMGFAAVVSDLPDLMWEYQAGVWPLCIGRVLARIYTPLQSSRSSD